MLDHELPATMPAGGDNTHSNSGGQTVPVTAGEPPPNLWPDHLGGEMPARLPAARKPVGNAAGGEIIRCQILHLIGEVLNDRGVEEDVRFGLLRNLAEHPGNPEQALLAHVKDWEGREDAEDRMPDSLESARPSDVGLWPGTGFGKRAG